LISNDQSADDCMAGAGGSAMTTGAGVGSGADAGS